MVTALSPGRVQQKVRLDGAVGKELFDPWRRQLPLGDVSVRVRQGGHLAVCAVSPLLSSHKDSQGLNSSTPLEKARVSLDQIWELLSLCSSGQN